MNYPEVPWGEDSSSASFAVMSEHRAGHRVGLVHMGLEEDLESGFKIWPPTKGRESEILVPGQLQERLGASVG